MMMRPTLCLFFQPPAFGTQFKNVQCRRIVDEDRSLRQSVECLLHRAASVRVPPVYPGKFFQGGISLSADRILCTSWLALISRLKNAIGVDLGWM